MSRQYFKKVDEGFVPVSWKGLKIDESRRLALGISTFSITLSELFLEETISFDNNERYVSERLRMRNVRFDQGCFYMMFFDADKKLYYLDKLDPFIVSIYQGSTKPSSFSIHHTHDDVWSSKGKELSLVMYFTDDDYLALKRQIRNKRNAQLRFTFGTKSYSFANGFPMSEVILPEFNWIQSDYDSHIDPHNLILHRYFVSSDL